MLTHLYQLFPVLPFFALSHSSFDGKTGEVTLETVPSHLESHYPLSMLLVPSLPLLGPSSPLPPRIQRVLDFSQKAVPSKT